MGLDVAVMIREPEKKLHRAVRAPGNRGGELKGSSLQLVPSVKQSPLGQRRTGAETLHECCR
jgi:hypothetical protein